MRLSVDLIQRSPQYVNAIRERELCLRGLKLPQIENLGATLDQFDTIDLTNNEIAKLPSTAPLKRLTTLLLSNNFINKITPEFADGLKNLENLVLINNRISSIDEIANLSNCKKLTMLQIVGNPITQLPNYRIMVIKVLPQIRVLDFNKIKKKERIQANQIQNGEKTNQEEEQKTS